MQLPFAKPVRGRKYDSAKLGGQEKFFFLIHLNQRYFAHFWSQWGVEKIWFGEVK